MAPGDVGVIDLTYPGRTLVQPARGERLAQHVTMILPRAQVASLLPGSDALGQQLIRGDGLYGRVLRELILDLWRHAGELRLAETEPAIQAAASLVAGGVGPRRGAAADREPNAQGVLRAAIQRFLDRRDTSPEQLGVTALCARFGISRASLYRMFEPDGGLVNQVRTRQLQRALECSPPLRTATCGSSTSPCNMASPPNPASSAHSAGSSESRRARRAGSHRSTPAPPREPGVP